MSEAIYAAEITFYDPGTAGERTLHFATKGFSTGSADTPATTHFDGRLVQPSALARRAFEGGRIGGRAKPAYGDLVLANDDGELDGWIDYGFDARDLVVRRGEEGAAYPGDWEVVIDGTMDGVPEVGIEEVRIRVRDPLLSLDVPFQTTKYAGTNSLPSGLEGTADDLKGKPKPRCYGKVRNISPPSVNTSKLIYQVNDGAVASVDAVYDRGVQLGRSGTSVEWERLAAGFALNLFVNCITFGDDAGVFVAGGTGQLATSPDGFIWTQRNPNSALDNLIDVAWGNSMFVGVGEQNTVDPLLITSPDGIVWTERISGFPAGEEVRAVAYSPDLGQWLIAGHGGRIHTSTDTITWTPQTSPFAANDLHGAVWASGLALWVVAGGLGEIATSPDGVTWTLRTSSFGTTIIYVVAWSEDLGLLAAGGAGGKLATSPDGVTWTQRTSGKAGNIAGLDYGGSDFGRVWVAVTTTGVSPVATSIDGVTWTDASSGVVTNGGNRQVAFGPGVAVFVSSQATYAAYAPAVAYASESDLLDDDIAPSPGSIGYYLAGGLFRLGSTPAGQITADVTQGANAAARTHGQIFATILDGPGGKSTGDWSAADITALDTATSAVIGLYADEETTVAAKLDEVAESAGAWWGADRNGVYRIQQLAAPSGTPDLELGEHDLLGDPSRVKSSDQGGGIPRWKSILRYQQNHTVQNSDLAGSVTDARRAFLAREYREVSDEDSSVQTKHPQAPQVTETCLIDSAADAQTEVERRQALLEVGRGRYLLPAPLNAATAEADLGDVVEVTHPRFGMSAGKLLRVLGVRPDAAAESIEIEGWG